MPWLLSTGWFSSAEVNYTEYTEYMYNVKMVVLNVACIQFCYYRTSGEIYIGLIKSHKYNSNRCLVDPGIGNVPGLYDCKLAKQKGFNMLWDFKQVMLLL